MSLEFIGITNTALALNALATTDLLGGQFFKANAGVTINFGLFSKSSDVIDEYTRFINYTIPGNGGAVATFIPNTQFMFYLPKWKVGSPISISCRLSVAPDTTVPFSICVAALLAENLPVSSDTFMNRIFDYLRGAKNTEGDRDPLFRIYRVVAAPASPFQDCITISAEDLMINSFHRTAGILLYFYLMDNATENLLGFQSLPLAQDQIYQIVVRYVSEPSSFKTQRLRE